MKILIKTLQQQNFHLDLEPTTTVLEVKQQISGVQGHAVENQKLICSGKILEDAKALSEYGLKDNDFLVLMVTKPKPVAAAAPSSSAAAPSKDVPVKKEEAPKDAPKPAEATPAASSAAAAPASTGGDFCTSHGVLIS
jgi:UV excision repair protein RAD23